MTYFAPRPKEEFMGKQTIGNYTYFGYKEVNSPFWKIIRKNDTDDSDWAYSYGSDDWAAVWAYVDSLTYGPPPN